MEFEKFFWNSQRSIETFIQLMLFLCITLCIHFTWARKQQSFRSWRSQKRWLLLLVFLGKTSSSLDEPHTMIYYTVYSMISFSSSKKVFSAQLPPPFFFLPPAISLLFYTKLPFPSMSICNYTEYNRNNPTFLSYFFSCISYVKVNFLTFKLAINPFYSSTIPQKLIWDIFIHNKITLLRRVLPTRH